MILYNHTSYFKSGEIESFRLSPLPTQGGYQVTLILPIKSKMAAAKKQRFLRFLYWTKSSPPSFKVRGLQMTNKFALV